MLAEKSLLFLSAVVSFSSVSASGNTTPHGTTLPGVTPALLKLTAAEQLCLRDNSPACVTPIEELEAALLERLGYGQHESPRNLPGHIPGEQAAPDAEEQAAPYSETAHWAYLMTAGSDWGGAEVLKFDDHDDLIRPMNHDIRRQFRWMNSTWKGSSSSVSEFEAGGQPGSSSSHEIPIGYAMTLKPSVHSSSSVGTVRIPDSHRTLDGQLMGPKHSVRSTVSVRTIRPGESSELAETARRVFQGRGSSSSHAWESQDEESPSPRMRVVRSSRSGVSSLKGTSVPEEEGEEEGRAPASRPSIFGWKLPKFLAMNAKKKGENKTEVKKKKRFWNFGKKD